MVDCIPSDRASHSIGTVRSDPPTGRCGSAPATPRLRRGRHAGLPDLRPRRASPARSCTSTATAAGWRAIPSARRHGPDACLHQGPLERLPQPVPLHAAPRHRARVGDVGLEPLRGGRPPSSAGGKNYGWPCYEAATRTPGYDADARCSGAGGEYSKEGTANADVSPVHNYPHPSEGAAIVGGPTYTGGGYPAQYQGSIFFGDYVLGTVSRLVPDGQADGRSPPSRARGPASLSRPLPATATSSTPTCSAARSAASSSRARPERSTTRAGRPTSASSSENASLGPEKAVDGDSTTRWSSGFSDGQWWQVDLGSAKTIDSVELNWEVAYASQYRIATSTDGTNFTTVADETIGQAGLHTTSFAPRSARYVRVTGIRGRRSSGSRSGTPACWDRRRGRHRATWRRATRRPRRPWRRLLARAGEGGRRRFDHAVELGLLGRPVVAGRSGLGPDHRLRRAQLGDGVRVPVPDRDVDGRDELHHGGRRDDRRSRGCTRRASRRGRRATCG